MTKKPRRGVQPTSAAGLRHRRLVDAAVAGRIAGQTMREIARAQNCSVSTVHAALMEGYHSVTVLDGERRRFALAEHLARCEHVMACSNQAMLDGDSGAARTYLAAAAQWSRAMGVESANDALLTNGDDQARAAVAAAARAEVAGFEARLRAAGFSTEQIVAVLEARVCDVEANA